MISLILIVGVALILLSVLGVSPSSPWLGDSQLVITKALPNGAANVTSAGIDTGKSDALGYQAGSFEFQLDAPALTPAEQPDVKTMTYDVIQSDNSDMSSPAALYPSVIIQTGASGAGAVAVSFKFRIPSNAKRYIAVKATGSAPGDASGKSFTLKILT